MSGFPIVITASGGAPFVPVASGAPVASVSANGLGVPVTLVSSGAPPLVVQGWTPTNLGAKNLLWWDAEDADSLTLAGSAVTAWEDKSAGFAVSQATGASQPALSATAVNNRPGIVFDGTDDYMTSAGTPGNVAAGQAREWWFLGTQTRAVSTGGTHVAVRQGSAITAAAQIGRTIDNAATCFTGNGSTAVSATATTLFAGVSVIRYEIEAAQQIVSRNGVAGTPVAVTPALDNASVFIGSRDAVSRFHQGAINTLIQTEPLTDAEAFLLLGFLKARGGIA
jgi:hypothetical protein